MIDIHTHLLYGVDDGVESLDEAIAILTRFEEQGVEHVFLTPHVAKERGYYQLDKFKTRFKKLREAIQDNKLSIKVHLGSEIDESDQLFDDIEISPSMNGTNVYMIDFGCREVDIEAIVKDYTAQGIHVIVAHPERYHYVSYKTLKAIKHAGGLFQVSAAPLAKLGSRREKRLAKRLLKAEMIDFVGSDTHSIDNPLDIMDQAYAEVKRLKGPVVAHRIFMLNAKALLCQYSE